MTRAAKKQVKSIIHDLGAKKYKRRYDWKGYEVYEPLFPGLMYVGGPLFVFVSGDKAWLASREEGFDYIDYRIEMDEKAQTVSNQV